MESDSDQGVPVETLGSNCRKDQAAGWMRIRIKIKIKIKIKAVVGGNGSPLKNKDRIS